MFDATEIDEILALRTMTLTDDEKAEARATDSQAAAIIDRVDTLPAEILDRLHGAVRYLRKSTAKTTGEPENVPWWDPGADASVSPESDSLQIDGVSVSKGMPGSALSRTAASRCSRHVSARKACHSGSGIFGCRGQIASCGDARRRSGCGPEPLARKISLFLSR